jgi:alpha-glucan phosphorylase-like protein
MRNIISNKPAWKELSVKPEFSGKLEGLDVLSRNLWWSWSSETVNLFKSISEEKGPTKCFDPLSILRNTSYKRFEELENDHEFIKKYNKVYKKFEHYIQTPYNENYPSIAYFSMEYGIANILKIFSGGLGMLAGDYLKEASDSGYNMVAVGLFYRQGYFTQKISFDGKQEAVYESQKFNDLPAELIKNEDGTTKTISIWFTGRETKIQIWKLNIGRISLLLLDTDREDNTEADRSITYRLYGGDHENRFKQEILLGLGGIRVLKLLNINQDIYHCNEGHAALIGLERIRNFVQDEKLSFYEALEIVRASSLFTTHTPVPAGHDAFDEEIVLKYLPNYAEKIGLSWNDFINLGKAIPDKKDEKFSMSVLAINFSQEINGVSKLHGEITRKFVFKDMWDGYFPEELPVGYVTNGVHFRTWASSEMTKLLCEDSYDPDFSRIYKTSSKEIWAIKKAQKKRLIEFIKDKLDDLGSVMRANPREILKIKNNIREDVLTIGFARRFATYKRGNLLFKDLDRLEKIINNPEMPIQFIFAGKAHPNDGGGQDIIKEIIEISKTPEFIGKIIFLENYDMSVAKPLVQGVDIWLNTPTRPLEASGTSGMKAVMNGVLNFSVLDGWWVEGYKEGAGWALDKDKKYENEELQNDLDSEVIFHKLETEIIPLYYNVNDKGIPKDWIEAMKKNIGEIAPEFTTKRMINDYQHRYYSKLQKTFKNIISDNYKLAKEISAWKDKIARQWNTITYVSSNISDPIKDPLILGEKYYGELVIHVENLLSEDIGVELVITQTDPDGEKEIVSAEKLNCVKTEYGNIFYSVEIVPPKPGSFEYAFRVFPQNKNLAYRQDCSFVKWM